MGTNGAGVLEKNGAGVLEEIKGAGALERGTGPRLGLGPGPDPGSLETIDNG